MSYLPGYQQCHDEGVVRQGMRGGAAAFGVMAAVTTGVVYWIHQQNFDERKQMREGVLKDLERVRQKEREFAAAEARR